MKIIFIHSTGAQRTFSLTRTGSIVLASAFFVIIAAGGFVLGGHVPQTSAGTEAVAQWRAKLGAQQDQVKQIKRRREAQNAAIGRQLAQMQARLLRMEAMGARMAQVAELPAGEFDFNLPPALGGPADVNEHALSWQDLSLELSQLASQIKRRELELEILGGVISDEETGEMSLVRGRPVTWGWLSSPYGQRVDPISGQTAWHAGVDFAGHEGSAVIAVASGVVTFAGERSGYGQLVEVSHPNGYMTRYAHLKSLSVQVGDVVKKGETLGLMGSSGRSTGPHVHFEVLKSGRNMDPANYVTSRY